MNYEFAAALDQEKLGWVRQALMGKEKVQSCTNWRDRFVKQSSLIEHFKLVPIMLEDAWLPAFSFFLNFQFRLLKPYISRDDTDFYILDNPVKKEWVFKFPYVAPSQWKGSLRATIRLQRGYATWEQEVSDTQMVRLFGNVKGEEEEFSSGRLHFYPTCFGKTDVEVINPHPRDSGVGKRPIYFECASQGEKGIFTLLYVPLDRIGEDNAESRFQALVDFADVAKGIRSMMTEYGFGAKTSSGYGLAEMLEGGYFVLKAPDQPEKVTRPERPEQPDVLRKILFDFPGEDFTLKPDAWRERHKASRAQRETYKQARAVCSEYRKTLQKYEATLKAWDTAEKSQPPKTDCTFSSFAELIDKVKAVGDLVIEEAGGRPRAA